MIKYSKDKEEQINTTQTSNENVDFRASSDPKRPFRILMIAPTSFFSDYGGHIRILEEVRALQEMGHCVAVVTYYKGSDMPGIDIRRTAPLPWRTDYEVGSSRHKLVFDLYLAVQSLIEGMRFRPDLIHAHMHEGALIGGILARFLRVPMVFDFQGSLTGEMVDHKFLNPNGHLFSLARLLETFISKRLPHAILTSSIRAFQLLRDEFQVLPEIIHPLPDCADTIRFDPEKFSIDEKNALRQKLNIPLDVPVVAYLGLLTEYQGIDQLIQVISQIKQSRKQMHFLIMGYPNVNKYRQIAKAVGVNDYITFTGKVIYRDAPLYLSLGDIAVAPKMSSTEGSGKLLNYMAMAQPVVVYDTPVHREYLADLGIFIPVGDILGFASAISDLIHNKERCEDLGKKLRQRAKSEYSWMRAGNKIVAIYQDLTREK